MNKRDIVNALRQKEYEDYKIISGNRFTKIESIVFLILPTSSAINITHKFITPLIIAIIIYFILRTLWSLSPINVFLSILFSIVWGIICGTIVTLIIPKSILQYICSIIAIIIGFLISFLYHKEWLRCLNRVNIE